MLALPPRRLAREGVPVAVILLFWSLLAAIAEPHEVGGSVRTAGYLMAALYVVVRGAGLASDAAAPATEDLEAVLAENARLALPAGLWFLGAIAVFFIGTVVRAQVRALTSVVTSLEGAFAGAGLGVVGLYAVATGFAAFDRGASSADASTADDRERDPEDSGVS